LKLLGEIEVLVSFFDPSLRFSRIILILDLDKTMDALAEANIDACEVDDAVRISGGDVTIGSDGIVDDDESEAERKALVEEAETAQRLKDVQAISEGLKVPQEHSVADPGFQEPSDI
jgi:charged multivesicular body protein 7